MKPIKRCFWLVLLIGGCLIGCSSQDDISAASRTVIVLKDLSLSTPAHQDSLDNRFICNLLSQLGAGDKIYVVGITETSFTNPFMLLQGEIPLDRHPLQAKVLKAREALAKSWNERRRSLKLQARQTDIIGAMCYASLLFKNDPSEKLLIILSDMRQSSKVLNLERETVIDADQALARIKNAGFLPDLSNVNVAVLGVHTTGKRMSPGYYQSLEAFWQRFLTEAHAELLTFQTDRNWKLGNDKPVSGVF